MTPHQQISALSREVRAAIDEARMKTGTNDVAVTVETEPHVRIRVWRREALAELWKDLPEYAEWLQVGFVEFVMVFLLVASEDSCLVFKFDVGSKGVVLNSIAIRRRLLRGIGRRP